MNALVSIIIPAYNAELYIEACLQSILNQTYHHLEILIIADAPTDNTIKIIQTFNDERIRVLINEVNLGLAASVNKAISEAKGLYMARMDADDIAHPQRLEKEIFFLEQNPGVSIVGTAMQSIGYSKYLHKFPESHEACKAQLLFNVCFGHPTVVMRKNVFNDLKNLYREDLQQYSEEYELWCRLVEKVKFANLPDVLLYYRTYHPAEKSRAEERRRINSFQIRKDFIISNWGEQTEADYIYHDHVCNLHKADTLNELTNWISWLERCARLNDTRQMFDNLVLQVELSKRAFELRYWNTHLGIKNLIGWYKKENQLQGFKPTLRQHVKFVLRTLLKL
ncbi:MAG: glycosyltransferase family 2 protein [Cyclobacteriaceae bacterium]|nr:glycosyltransferase family 2 protein [Cyclobacteriaceae bacterium]